MRPKFFYCSSRMCQRFNTRHVGFSEKCQLPSCGPVQKDNRKPSSADLDPVYEAWLASRAISHRRGVYLVPGTQRPFTRENARLACIITKQCAFELFSLLWRLHPIRTTLMMTLNVVRSLFPAFRGVSQALIIDEVCLTWFTNEHSLNFFSQSLVAIVGSLWPIYLVAPLATHGGRDI